MKERNKVRLGILAVALIFFINGVISLAVLPRYADISASLGLGTAALGLARTGEPLGLAVVSTLLALGLARRFGSRLSYGLPLVLYCLSPVLIAIANSGPTLFAAQVVRGASNAPVDLAQNTLALGISAYVGRKLLPRFEIAFSVGALAGAGAGAFTAGRVGLVPYLGGMSIVVLALGLVAWRFMPAAAAPPPKAEESKTVARGNRGLWVLAALAFFSLLAEFVGQDWSSVFYSSELHANPTQAGYGGFAFQVGFIAALLFGTQLAERFGSARVVRVGGAIFTVAMLVFVLSHSVVVATAALAVAGIGAGNLVPLALSGLEGHPDYKVWVARITAVMYLGPGASKLVGVLAAATSLRWALAIAVPVGVVIVFLASVLRPPQATGGPEVER